jgi:hypothetical protein
MPGDLAFLNFQPSLNYILMQQYMMIDGYPGGTMSPENLPTFNAAMKLEFIRY